MRPRHHPLSILTGGSVPLHGASTCLIAVCANAHRSQLSIDKRSQLKINTCLALLLHSHAVNDFIPAALGSRSVSPGCFSLEQPAPVGIAGVAPLYIRRNTLSSSLFSLSRWHSRTIITTTAYRTTLPLADPAHRWTIRCRCSWYDPLRRCGNSVRDFRAGGGRRWRHLLCRDPPWLAVTILPMPGPYLAGRWMAIECTGERSGAWDYIPFTCRRRPRDLSLYICR